jgi:proteasome lid subunit RPN8/RPN11
MTLDMTGISALDYIGDVHSHPNGNPLPSQADWDGFLNNNQQARNAGRTQDTFYMYIITVDSSGNPTGIRVYQDGPRSANSPNPDRPTSTGPEVNPDAQPCP